MGEGKEILLINRDREFLEAMAEFLRKSGYTVHTAQEMQEALLALTFYSIGLILCDNVLNDITGYDFLRFLKNDPLRNSIPFVFFVPINDQGRAFKAFELGADDFLVYPMEVDDLVSRIKEIMELHYPEETELPKEDINIPGLAFSPSAKISFLDRRKSKRKQPFPNFKVYLSRDETFWMPGKVKNFSRDGILVLTPLLGKPGVSLLVKFTLPQETFTIRGEIKHVAFDDFQQPVGIGITFTSDSQWAPVYEYFNSLITSTSPSPIPQISRKQPSQTVEKEIEKTVLLSPEEISELEESFLAASTLRQREESYELRFYQSLIGKQLGNYRAVCFLGAGSMGGVFRGWDSALEREVALKVISYELSSQESFRAMFIKEARIISQLDHPNIAHIYSIGDIDGILFFAMELIVGETLADLIKKHGNLNTLRGLDYFLTVCETLDFVWQKNIIHRDIKPANIVINNKGVLKIVDFGVAQKIGVPSPFREGSEKIVGSPFYISPEVISGGKVDHRSDIYSLGATFYHVFTGHPPFEGNDPKEILLQHLNRKLQPLKEKNHKVSSFLSGIIEKMMAKDHSERYQSYREIIQDLKYFRSLVIQAKKKK